MKKISLSVNYYIKPTIVWSLLLGVLTFNTIVFYIIRNSYLKVHAEFDIKFYLGCIFIFIPSVFVLAFALASTFFRKISYIKFDDSGIEVKTLDIRGVVYKKYDYSSVEHVSIDHNSFNTILFMNDRKRYVLNLTSVNSEDLNKVKEIIFALIKESIIKNQEGT